MVQMTASQIVFLLCMAMVSIPVFAVLVRDIAAEASRIRQTCLKTPGRHRARRGCRQVRVDELAERAAATVRHAISELETEAARRPA